jgi:hypothetical protein
MRRRGAARKGGGRFSCFLLGSAPLYWPDTSAPCSNDSSPLFWQVLARLDPFTCAVLCSETDIQAILVPAGSSGP